MVRRRNVVLVLKIVAVGVASAIVIVCIVGWFWLRNPDRFLPKVIAEAQQRTGLQIEIKHLEIRYIPLSIRVYGLEVKDPKPFPPGDFLTVPMLEATVKWTPLLHREIVIGSLVLNQPTIDFINDPDGLWNFQNPAQPKNQPQRLSMGSIATLHVKNGVLLGSNLIDPSDKPGPIILDLRGLNGDLKQISFRPPRHSTDTLQAIQGDLTATNAAFGSIHTTDLKSQIRILPLELIFKNFEAKTYRGKASGDLIFNFQSKNTTFKTDLQVSGVGMPYLLAEFENGPPKITGMMKGKLNAAGAIEHTSTPLAGMYGKGDITV
ncbi:MAG: AsmA family protein, partial [Acidobacteriaceae bacterium]